MEDNKSKWKCQVVSDPSKPKPEGAVRIICFSDTHTLHNKIPKEWLYPADIAVHAGDFSSIGSLSEINSFKEFFKSLPCKHRIVVCGNHELTFDEENRSEIIGRYCRLERTEQNQIAKILKVPPLDLNSEVVYRDELINYIKKQISEDDDFIYLEESSAIVEGIKFYGSPYTEFFYNWAFPMSSDFEIQNGGLEASRWNKIPDDVDVLVTHSPPESILDESEEHRIGSHFLGPKIEQVKPSLCIFGHIHEAYGCITKNDITYANASILNRKYLVSNKPFVFDLTRE